MAMFPSMITNMEIDQLIRSEKFRVFHEKVRVEMKLDNMNYEILVEDFVKDKEGYFDSSINARMKINKEWDRIDALVFFNDGLRTSINSNYSKLPKIQFYDAVDICVNFALVHELVHVQQFKMGRLNKDKLEALKEIPYKDRDIEIEANSIAKEIIINGNEFNRKIINILLSNKVIDNDELQEILNVHKMLSL